MPKIGPKPNSSSELVLYCKLSVLGNIFKSLALLTTVQSAASTNDDNTSKCGVCA